MNARQIKRIKDKKIETLQSDIQQLQHKIKKTKYTNFKNTSICNLKIAKEIGLYITPFVLATAMATGLVHYIGEGYPFIKDQDLKVTKKVSFSYQTEGPIEVKEFYQGNISQEEQKLVIAYPIDEKDSPYDEIVRDYTLSLSSEDFKTLQEAILEKDFQQIDQIDLDYKEYYSTEKEDRKLTEPQVDAHFFYKDDTDYMNYTETDEHNLFCTVSALLIAGIGGILFHGIAPIDHFRNMKYSISEYQNQKISDWKDTTPLEEELEMKKTKIKQLGGNLHVK